MEKIRIFYLKSCPHCKKAFRLIDELKKEQPLYAEVEAELIEESEQPEFAEKFDYYYVPCFYVGAIKIHEGAVSREDIEKVLSYAIKRPAVRAASVEKGKGV